MKSLIVLALAASLATEAVATSHQNAHAHQNAHRSLRRRAASRVDRRDPALVTEWVATATETVYVLAGESIPKDEAVDGLEDGSYAIIGQTTPKVDTSVGEGAEFYEKETSSEPEPTPTPTPTPEPTPEPEPENEGDYSGGGSGLTREFDSGKVPCSHFPSEYGAVAIDYLGTGGWAGIQRTPKYSPGDASISYIETAVDGDDCTKGAFCSYACPPGSQKTQWPDAQGDTRQSIGGLYCNSNGMLELTRKSHKTLCSPGVEGIYIQNDLGEVVSTCRTDYPGTESMVIPTICNAGEKQPLTNPYSPDYYKWGNDDTTAQYYVNKKGVSAKDACVWNSKSDHDARGNWAPVNIGTGKNKDGLTFLSIFPNKPTTNAMLDFNIEITGDISAKCALVNGQYTGGSNGCTVAIPDGGSATIRYYK